LKDYKKEFILPEKTWLSNTIYGISSEFKYDVITTRPRTCMKSSSALEMQHSWDNCQIKMKCTT